MRNEKKEFESKRIFLVEDDRSLGEILKERLCENGFLVDWLLTVHDAEKKFLETDADVAIIDVNLPDGSGFELARFLKKKKAIPFIFLTAMNTAENRLIGYEIGAEEYIPKPFHFQELLIRLRHVIENHTKGTSVECPVGKIDLRARVILDKDEQPVKVAAKEFDVLMFLIDQSPAVLSRDEILNAVWGVENFPSNRTIDNMVSRIRQVIKDDKNEYIRSVRSVGYQWVAAGAVSKKVREL